MLAKVDAQIVAIVILVFVIVVVIIYLYHAMQIKATPRHGGKVIVHATYVVTAKRNAAGRKVFYLNGSETPTLTLRRNVYYEFRNDSSYPLYFTLSPKGGPGAPQSLAKQVPKEFIGMANGTIFFMVTPDLPNEFYYQCGTTEHMGGQVVIV